MAENLLQVFTENPASSMATSDLLYLVQSPYTVDDDAGITFDNFQKSITKVSTLTEGVWNGTTIGIPYGGTGVTSVTTVPTASAWTGWDANSNLSANNLLEGFETTVASASTTVLTVASPGIQQVTGSTTHTITMPVVSTLALGQSWLIINNSSGDVTVESSGGNTIQVLDTNSSARVTCVALTGTGAASWNSNYTNDTGGVTSLTGTPNQVIVSSPTGDVVLSLPQDIATTSTPLFAGLTLTSPLGSASGGTGVDNAGLTIDLSGATLGYVLTADSSGNATWEPVSTSGAITTINGDSGSITPTTGAVTINGGSTGLTTLGSGSTLSLLGTLLAGFGGTGLSSYAQGDLIYASGATTLVALAKSTSATRYLSNTGTTNNPAWAQVDLSNGVTGNLPVTNLNSGTSASSSTFWRGDGTWAAPAGSGTVNNGTANQLAYYATTGTAVSGLTSANWSTLSTNGSGVPSLTRNVGIANALDANGNAIFNFNGAGTPVNYFSSYAGQTGNPCQFSAVGSDTNVSAQFNAQGTGTFTFVTTAPSNQHTWYGGTANQSVVNWNMPNSSQNVTVTTRTTSGTMAYTTDTPGGGATFYANQATTNVNAITTINYTNVVNDSASGYSAGTYTIPTTGWYIITGGMQLNNYNYGAGAIMQCHINRNGTAIAGQIITPTAYNSTTGTLNVATTYLCTAGDTITISAQSNMGGGTNTLNGGVENFFSVMFLRT